MLGWPLKNSPLESLFKNSRKILSAAKTNPPEKFRAAHTPPGRPNFRNSTKWNFRNFAESPARMAARWKLGRALAKVEKAQGERTDLGCRADCQCALTLPSRAGTSRRRDVCTPRSRRPAAAVAVRSAACASWWWAKLRLLRRLNKGISPSKGPDVGRFFRQLAAASSGGAPRRKIAGRHSGKPGGTIRVCYS
jgi:hypothetical protein